MSVNDSQTTFILDQLNTLTTISTKRMFGGVGFFIDGKMFGMLNGRGIFLLKVDDSNRNDYIDRSALPFSHDKNKKGSMPYYEVPLDIVDNGMELTNWARKSIEIAKKK